MLKTRPEFYESTTGSILKSHIRSIINRNWVIVKVIVNDQRSRCIKLVSFVFLVKEFYVLSNNNFYHVVHQQPQWLAPYHLSRLAFRLFINEWKSIKWYHWMKLGISIHLDFYRSRELTIQNNEGELNSRCIIVSSSTLLKVLFGITISYQA